MEHLFNQLQFKDNKLCFSCCSNQAYCRFHCLPFIYHVHIYSIYIFECLILSQRYRLPMSNAIVEGEFIVIILIRSAELLSSYHDDRFDLAKGLIRWRSFCPSKVDDKIYCSPLYILNFKRET